MPAIPQNTISDIMDLILAHIHQTSHDLAGTSSPARIDGRELQGIDEEIDALEETAISLQASLNARIVQRRKQRNSFIRFNQLPLEITSNILWLSIVDPWPRKISYSFVLRQQIISSVCSSWRTLVEDSPRFWSIVEFSYPLAAISHFLEKSQSSGLEIKSFQDSSEYDCSPREYFTERVYSSLIAPHAHRIRSLILSLRSTDELLAVLGKPAPVLEELRLDSEVYEFEQPLDLFSGQANRLMDVALENIPVRWDSDVLVGLRSLSMKGEVQHLPTEGQVRRLLETNPRLEKLNIEGGTETERFGNDAAQPTGQERSIRVVMGKMQELRLFNLSFELVQAVLGHVEIPAIRSLKLVCLFGGQPASRLLGPSIKHLVPHLVQRSRGTHRAELTFGESSMGLAIYKPGYDSPTIGIKLKQTVPTSGFDWLAANLFHAEGLPSVCAAEIFEASLKFKDAFDMTGGTFMPILDGLSAVKVKNLTVEASCDQGEELIKYLGEPKDSHWPLPYLTSMTIGGPAELAEHLSIALQRRMQYAATGEQLVTPRPAMLEALDIGDMRGVEEDVEKALAECVTGSGTFIPGRRRKRRVHRRRPRWDEPDEDDILLILENTGGVGITG
ncbi:hypothetical protein FS837_012400 [Tulasnella sp. UAMH 9824]|nr:hypothetical protein FS837_012400 [Tulasnella sp. UAMH 9824]